MHVRSLFTVTYLIGSLMVRVFAALMSDCEVFASFKRYVYPQSSADSGLKELYYSFYETSTFYFTTIFATFYLVRVIPGRSSASLVQTIGDIILGYFVLLLCHMGLNYGRCIFVVVAAASICGALWAMVMVSFALVLYCCFIS